MIITNIMEYSTFDIKPEEPESQETRLIIAEKKHYINVYWKEPWTSGGFLTLNQPLVYIACKDKNPCYVAIFDNSSLEYYQQELYLWKSAHKYCARLIDSYRCKSNLRVNNHHYNYNYNDEATNVFILERLSTSSHDFFKRIPLDLNDLPTYVEATIEINKIFNLLIDMNNDGIYHRDAHTGNIMCVNTSQGLIWKMIDIETVYLIDEDYGDKESENGAFGMSVNSLDITNDINKGTRGKITGIYIDILSFAVSLIDLNEDYYQLFPNWVKLIIQDAKMIKDQYRYLYKFPDFDL